MPDTSTTLSDLGSELGISAQSHQAEPGAAAARIRRLAGYALLGLADACSVTLALAAVLFVAGTALHWPLHLGGAGPVAWLASIVALLATNMGLGLYEVSGRDAVERFRLRVWSAVMLPAFALTLFAVLGAGNEHALVAFALTAALWLPLGLVAETLTLRWLVAHSAWGLRALLVGDASATAPIAAFLHAHPEVGLRPVGFCGDPGAGPATIARLGVACLGSVAQARHLGDAADVAIVALSPAVAALDLAGLPFRRILVLPEATGLPALWLRSRALGNSPALEFRHPLQAAANLRAKRVLDIMLAVPLIVVTAPVCAVVAACIFIISPGPVFYVQRRVGWHGKPLQVLKMRSMHLDAERRLHDLLQNDPAAMAEWTRCVKLRRDPRVLPFIGNLIRRTSVDELPQLWNVLRGDMSIVGPRPFPSYHMEMFDPEFRTLRCSVRPGLTGLWQVSERSNADLPQQKSLDTFYIRNWSLWFDLYIAFRTVPAVLSSQGAR